MSVYAASVSHFDAAVAHLLSQYKDKPRIEAFLRAFTDELDELESALHSLFTVWDHTAPERVIAERLARFVGQPLVSDVALLRELTALRRYPNRSEGTADELLLILDAVTSVPFLIEYFPKTVVVGLLDDTTAERAGLLAALLRDVPNVVTRLFVLWSTYAYAEVFQISDDGTLQINGSYGLGKGHLAGAFLP